MTATVDKKRLMRDLASLAGAFAAVTFAGLVSDLLLLPGMPEFAVRPQVGVIVGALLLVDKRLRPIVAVLSFLGTLTTCPPSAMLPIAVIAACTVAEAVAFCLVIDAACPGLTMANPVHVIVMIAASTVCCTAVAGLASIAPAARGAAKYVELVQLWAMSDAVSVALVVPFVASLKGFMAKQQPRDVRETVEIVLLFASAALLGGAWFFDLPRNASLVFFMLTSPMPFLLLAGTRFGIFGSATASIILFISAIWGTALGKGVMPIFMPETGERMSVICAYSMWFSLVPLFNASSIERKRSAEQTLAASERKNKLIIDSINDIIIVLDAQGRIVSANPAFDRLMGIEGTRIIGRSVKALIVAEDGPRAAECLDRVFHLKSRVEHLIFRLMKNDGAFLVVEAMALNMLEDDAVHGVIVTMHDLTERSLAAERLMAANAELEEANESAEAARADAERALAVKSAFLSNMSHEIRTPLTGMMGMASLLSKTELDERQAQYLDGLRQSSRVLLGIVNDILDSEKLDYDAVKPKREPTDARALCLSALANFEALAREKGLSLESGFEDVEGRVFVDQRLLGRILSNLIGNAVKFTESGGVRLEARYDERRKGGPGLTVSIRDTGIGIDPEEIGSLFVRFSQLDSSYSKKYEGTGLGLHIAKRAAELMGGDIRVESERGKGSAFTVSIPCQRERTSE